MSKIHITDPSRGSFDGYVAESSYCNGSVLSQNQVIGPNDEPLTLRGGFVVRKCFYIQIIEEVRSAINYLESIDLADTGEKLETKHFFGKYLWADLGKENGKLAGRCVAQAVRNGRLQLRRVVRKGGSAKYIINL